MSEYFEDTRARMLENIKTESSKIDGTFTADNINAVALEFDRFKTMEVDTIVDDVMIDTATGINLDKAAKKYFETRKKGEDDNTFRNRIYEKIRKRISSGNKNHYKYWAKQVKGISKAKVIPLASGRGTVKVIVLSDDYGVVSDEVLENVRNHIENNRPVGASVEVVSAVAKSIVVNMKLVLSSEADISFIKESISEKIGEYIKEIVFDESKVFSYYKVGDIAFDVSGVVDILDYFVNGVKESIRCTSEEYFNLSEVVINAK